MSQASRVRGSPAPVAHPSAQQLRKRYPSVFRSRPRESPRSQRLSPAGWHWLDGLGGQRRASPRAATSTPASYLVATPYSGLPVHPTAHIRSSTASSTTGIGATPVKSSVAGLTATAREDRLSRPIASRSRRPQNREHHPWPMADAASTSALGLNFSADYASPINSPAPSSTNSEESSVDKQQLRLNHLPYDVLSLIAAKLAPDWESYDGEKSVSALAAFNGTCRKFYKASLQALWSTIVIRPDQPGLNSISLKARKSVRTLALGLEDSVHLHCGGHGGEIWSVDTVRELFPRATIIQRISATLADATPALHVFCGGDRGHRLLLATKVPVDRIWALNLIGEVVVHCPDMTDARLPFKSTPLDIQSWTWRTSRIVAAPILPDTELIAELNTYHAQPAHRHTFRGTTRKDLQAADEAQIVMELAWAAGGGFPSMLDAFITYIEGLASTVDAWTLTNMSFSIEIVGGQVAALKHQQELATSAPVRARLERAFARLLDRTDLATAEISATMAWQSLPADPPSVIRWVHLARPVSPPPRLLVPLPPPDDAEQGAFV